MLIDGMFLLVHRDDASSVESFESNEMMSSTAAHTQQQGVDGVDADDHHHHHSR